MDRCRCAEYEAAVKKIKFYTVGTHRPDIIENYDRGEYDTIWVRHLIDSADLKFLKPKAYKRLNLENSEMTRIQQIEKMWCPYMTPVKR